LELACVLLLRAPQAARRVAEVETGYRERIGESKLETFADGWRHLHLILLLAPDLLLVGPGATLVVIGALLSLMGFLRPSGVELGSLRWQPVFFSSIALVLGTQALLAGAVLAHRSSVASRSVKERVRFVGSPQFPSGCMVAGAVAVAIGLVLDFVLFLGWVNGRPSPPVSGLAVAALAQSLLIVGGTLASFGAISRLLPAPSPPPP
jgi:hypothetical protein